MSGFSVEWLALREGYDRRARNPAVLGAVTSLLAAKGAVSVVDLACGAGSTFRTLSPLLPKRQHWDLVDNDPRLLDAARKQNTPDGISLNAVQLDLGGDFDAVFDRPCDLVTISALLDLVSADWLERFGRAMASRGLPVYAALTYDGRIDLSPPDPDDAAVVAAVNAHQRTDKGFGAALGPSGAAAAVSMFERLGYAVVQGVSDWTMEGADRQMQIELLDGWAAAAREMKSLPGTAMAGWLDRRKTWVERQASTMLVGHVDFLATPITTR